MSFADPLKQMLITGLRLDREQVYGNRKEEVDSRYGCSPRHMMQTLGTEWGRRFINEDLWLIAMSNYLAPYTIITDVRFENEAAFVRQRGVLIHVERPRKIGAAHSSEHGIGMLPDDLVLFNDGALETFQQQVANLVKFRL